MALYKLPFIKNNPLTELTNSSNLKEYSNIRIGFKIILPEPVTKS
jgi:hypothetical protein